jgi:hypothetical protein
MHIGALSASSFCGFLVPETDSAMSEKLLASKVKDESSKTVALVC